MAEVPCSSTSSNVAAPATSVPLPEALFDAESDFV